LSADTITLHEQPSSSTADGVLYALDATAHRDALQDVAFCKTALLRMKQLLQQVTCCEICHESIFVFD